MRKLRTGRSLKRDPRREGCAGSVPSNPARPHPINNRRFRRLSARNSRMFSSRPGGSKRQDAYPRALHGYLETPEHMPSSQLALQAGIKSGAEIKPELSDSRFEETFESGDQGFSEILDPALANVARQVTSTEPFPKKARHSSSQRSSVGLLPS
ncbi:hypothetical protein ISCGN_010371 [Ixodes scapularis]